MIDWTARAAEFLKTPCTPTDKTDEMGVVSVLSVPPPGSADESPGVSSVSSVGGGGGCAKSIGADGGPVSQRWRLIEGDTVREVTVAPAASKAEIERRYPAAVVEPGMGPALDPKLLATVQALGPLLGERDPGILAGQASAEGEAWVRDCVMHELLRDPEAAIGSLSDQEAVDAAIAVLTAIRVSEGLERALGPILPAMEGRYGRLEHRGQHARTVLSLIADDSEIRSTHTAPGGAQ